jgi:glycine cleavage system H protein
MSVPSHLKYTSDHEWLAIDGDVATIGVTAFAADALGDVVYVNLPEVGSTVTGGDSCGELESTKSVSDLYAPVDGEVLEVNRAVVDEPGLLNLEPFERGWLYRIRVTGSADLLDADAYETMTGGD